ncbi:MAG TPA: signal recognition particle protein [Pyrinomonadaceae bacterium]|jgi:signal recognition particle subunit SRP54|nr:signal recognition particle protein [Pyrinomonadaceae bacterium]
MFESLSDKLKRTLKNLRGEGVLTPEHVDAALREIRLALLEADVNYKVAKEFIASVKEKAEGQQVWQELKPSEQVVKIVYDELVELMGGQSSRLVFTKAVPNVVMIVGLQGSGKTTSTGKIALWLAKNQERKPLLVSTDVNRPAAREQLKVIAKATGQSIFEMPESNNPVELAREAYRHAQQTGYDTLLIDTAGRLHIDEELMDELKQIKAETHPVEVLFVADAMTGQDAVKSGEQFHAQVGVTGVVLTKMDGDARGGAALSIKQVTGQPVKFVGVGEKYDALEPFYPDRIAQRILGMGDVLSLIEQVQSQVDQSEAEAQLKKLQKNEFTLDDFRSQLRQVKKLGSFSKIMKLLPDQLLGGMGMPDLDEEQSAQMERELKRTEAIIDSMTREERGDHRILNASRRRRIARGSGVNVSEVNALIKQYVEMRGMMKQLSGAGLFGGGGGGGGMKGRMMRKLGGMMGMPDMSGLMGGGGGDGEGGMNLPALPGAGGSGRKKLRKKPRHKKRK